MCSLVAGARGRDHLPMQILAGSDQLTDLNGRTDEIQSSRFTDLARAVGDCHHRLADLNRQTSAIMTSLPGPPAARSVLLTMLGEYVLPLRDGVWQETLIAALGVLDYKTHAARQALAVGEKARHALAPRELGRERYRLPSVSPSPSRDFRRPTDQSELQRATTPRLPQDLF